MDQTVKHEIEIKNRAQEDAIDAANNFLKRLELAKVNVIDVVHQTC